MRLALVTETFPPEVNGVSMTLGRLCHGLSSKGWEVQVVRPEQQREEWDLPAVEQPFEEMTVAGVPLPGYKGLRMGEPAFFSIASDWRRRRPDVVHVATEGPLGLAALLAAKQISLPVISTFHTNFDQYSGHYNIGFIRDFAARYLRAVHNACGATLAPTQQMADELAEMGYRNTGVLSRGVDTSLFSPGRRDEDLRREWDVSGEGRVSLYVGRIAKEKNIDLALKTFQAILAQRPQDKMVVVGDGPESERLRKMYPGVVFAGMRQGEDLARHYASGDLFLFPSVTETFGNVVTEAMASGLGVVTFDYAAGRQHIESGVNGILAAFDDESAFADAALALRALTDDAFDDLRRRARRTAESISWESVIAHYERTVSEVIARHGSE